MNSTTITYALTQSPLGQMLVASTDKGVCMVSLDDKDNTLVNALHSKFPDAQIERKDSQLSQYINILLKYLNGEDKYCNLPLDVEGTPFQKLVWNQLQKTTYGQTRTYEELARDVGRPKAIRAVANACANNPTSLVVPCHRIIRKSGHLGGYRWKLERKEALLNMEKLN